MEHYIEELKNSKETLGILSKRLSVYDSLESKYEETKKMLEDSLMLKMRH
jgi:hypothetical protein